jgi:hypothetical protein
VDAFGITAAAAGSPAHPGRVRLEIVDARTLAPPEHATVRFLNARRFAECAAAGAVDVALTSGGWDGVVTAAGFETERLAPFEVMGGESLDLGRIALERGSGSVEGRITAHHLAPDRPVVVELFGEGRSPCDDCLAGRPGAAREDRGRERIGADCGYGEDRDQLTVVGDRTFRFAHLAAGSYWLRAYDPSQRIHSVVKFGLGRGGHEWRELDVLAPTTARFELRHADGRRFTGAWVDPHEGRPAPIKYEFRRDGRLVGAVETTPSREETLASVGPPLADPGCASDAGKGATAPPWAARIVDAADSEIVRITLVQGRPLPSDLRRSAVELGLAALEDANAADASRPIDRERTGGETLDLQTSEPLGGEIAPELSVIRPDCHDVAPLPQIELTLTVACGGYRSKEIALDLRREQTAPIAVVLALGSPQIGH